tara:strand:+ start:336 stop:512 length:177 start_codon:yes stop_codon:yes gene_type:complete
VLEFKREKAIERLELTKVKESVKTKPKYYYYIHLLVFVLYKIYSLPNFSARKISSLLI